MWIGMTGEAYGFERLGGVGTGSSGSLASRTCFLAFRRRRCHDASVAAASAETASGRGYEALARGDREGARTAFQEALDAKDSVEALDALRDADAGPRSRAGPNRGECPYRCARPDAILFGSDEGRCDSEQNKRVVREYQGAS
jgi:hypothetical protein